MMREIDVSVHGAEAVPLSVDPARLQEAVLHVLKAEGIESAEISVVLLADDEIAGMNEQYLAHAGPTDVISFPLHEEGQTPLGDIYIGAEQAARQAAELNIALDEELLRLTVHGMLHILGYDHPEDEGREASEMYRRQEELLRRILPSGSP